VCLAAEGEAGNGLQLKKIRLVFSSFHPCFLENHQKLVMVCSPFEKTIRYLSLDILGTCAREKALNLNFNTFFTQKREYPVT